MTEPTKRAARMVWDYLSLMIWVILCYGWCIAFILLWPECIMNACGHDAKAYLAAIVFAVGAAYMPVVWLAWRVMLGETK